MIYVLDLKLEKMKENKEMRIDNKSNIRLKSNIMIQSKIKSKTREHFMPAELIVDLFPYKKDIRYQVSV